ncbi:hypothetical protein L7F22_007625 [Adiantum nelumboides]|nr:hypothetical protein [Adiantum nelumboides]
MLRPCSFPQLGAPPFPVVIRASCLGVTQRHLCCTTLRKELSLSDTKKAALEVGRGGALAAFYADNNVVSLPDGHRFPMDKYRATRLMLEDDTSLVDLLTTHVSPAASIQELCLVHKERYVHSILKGELSEKEQRNLGFPWSPELVTRSRASTGGTVAAMHCVMLGLRRAAANIAGGTHHAFSDHGEGFCVFNDIAVAARVAVEAYPESCSVERPILVFDLDVHQGNGTAKIFEEDDRVVTFSMHGANNYPWRTKMKSDYDVDLPDDTGDEVYLAALSDWLQRGLFQNLGTKLNFSSAYHPQTDGQSEIANSIVLDLLKAYVTEVDQHNQWEKYLPLVEYAYNNTVNTSTGDPPQEPVLDEPPEFEGPEEILQPEHIIRHEDKVLRNGKKKWMRTTLPLILCSFNLKLLIDLGSSRVSRLHCSVIFIAVSASFVEGMDENSPSPCLTFLQHEAAYRSRVFKSKHKTRRLSARDLLNACVKLVDDYNCEALPDIAPDDHAKIVMPTLNVTNTDDQIFLTQEVCFKSASKKVATFMKFVFSQEDLSNACKPEWIKIYDTEYVGSLIRRVCAWTVEADELSRRLEEKISVIKQQEKHFTTFKAFNLSTAQKKPTITDENKAPLAPPPFKAKLPPEWKGGPTPTQKALEAVCKESREKFAMFYSSPKNQPFHLHILERPSKFSALKEQVPTAFPIVRKDGQRAVLGCSQMMGQLVCSGVIEGDYNVIKREVE